MNNYIAINDKKIYLTDEQVKEIISCKDKKHFLGFKKDNKDCLLINSIIVISEI